MHGGESTEKLQSLHLQKVHPDSHSGVQGAQHLHVPVQRLIVMVLGTLLGFSWYLSG